MKIGDKVLVECTVHKLDPASQYVWVMIQQLMVCVKASDVWLTRPKPIPDVNEAGSPEYLKLLDELRELHTRKAADYGRGTDPLANARASTEFGVPSWVGVMIRAADKMHRIKSFVANGNLKNESVEDSLKDLAAYALIALVLYREQAATGGRSATLITEEATQP